MEKQKIVIFTAQFGAGHMMVSKAIKNRIGKLDESIEVEIVDFFNLFAPKADKWMYKIYELLTKDSPTIYNFFYDKKKNQKKNLQDEIAAELSLMKLEQYLQKEKPALVIATFPLCAHAVSKHKIKTGDQVPLITCITDVVDSWEWLSPKTDTYFVPTVDVKNKLVEKGISPTSIQVTGIPVREDFATVKNLNSGTFNNKVLIMGGGRGLLDFEITFLDWIDKHPKMTATIVTGTNKKLYDLLIAKQFKSIKVLGYVTDVASLMLEHDVLISKPGGVTLFESIYTNIPILIKEPSIGQEIENARFIESKGIGIVNRDTKDFEDSLVRLMESKEAYHDMRASIFEIQKGMDISIVEKSVSQYMERGTYDYQN